MADKVSIEQCRRCGTDIAWSNGIGKHYAPARDGVCAQCQANEIIKEQEANAVEHIAGLLPASDRTVLSKHIYYWCIALILLTALALTGFFVAGIMSF